MTITKMESDNMDCVVLSSVITRVPEAFFVEAEKLEVDLVCTAFMPDFWEHDGLLRCVCGFVVDENGLVDFNSCFRSLNRKVAWKAISCKLAQFFSLQY